jgi:hypothetical protein
MRGRTGLLEKLVGAVCPEFRADVLTPASNDPILGWKTCAVEDCGRFVSCSCGRRNGVVVAGRYQWAASSRSLYALITVRSRDAGWLRGGARPDTAT